MLSNRNIFLELIKPHFMHFVNIDGKRTDSEKFCPYQRQTERCTMKNKKLATSLQVGVNNILTQPFSSPRNSRNKRPSIG